MNGMYGRKVGMTQMFTDAGEFVPVTAIEMSPNVVYQVKTEKTDGYSAVQVGLGTQLVQRLNKAQVGHLSKAEKGFPKKLREIRTDKYFLGQEFTVGQEIVLDGLFTKGQKVDVVGTSLGKGFQGVIKKHNMKGAQTQTHGTHEYFRHVGSIGNRKFPGRVFKNKRMPGHMGAETVQVQSVVIVDIIPEKNMILIKGGIPGANDSTIFVRSAVKLRTAKAA